MTRGVEEAVADAGAEADGPPGATEADADADLPTVPDGAAVGARATGGRDATSSRTASAATIAAAAIHGRCRRTTNA